MVKNRKIKSLERYLPDTLTTHKKRKYKQKKLRLLKNTKNKQLKNQNIELAELFKNLSKNLYLFNTN